MKYVLGLIILIFFTPNLASAVWFDSNWDYRVKVEINPDKVAGSANLTNYPVYLNLANLPADFHTNVKADGCDIRMVESDETTETAFELVSYASSTDTGELHFKADSLSYNATTTFYVYYGNSAASCYAVTDTYGRNAVWSDYARVYHLSEGSGNRTDSTGNLDVTGTTRGAVSGLLGDSNDFEESSSDYLSSANTGLVNVNNINIELVFKAESFTDTYPVLASVWNDSSDSRAWALAFISSNLYFYVTDNGANSGSDTLTSAVLSTNTDYYTTHTFEGLATSNFNTYINGNSYSKTSTIANSVANETTNFQIGHAVTFAGNPGSTYWDGLISEVRIRTSGILTANWHTTRYNNQSSPSTFYFVGAQETNGGGPVPSTDSGIIWFD